MEIHSKFLVLLSNVLCELLLLLQALLARLRTLQSLLVRIRRVPHGAHRLVVGVQAEADAAVERGLRLLRGVHVHHILRHHALLHMVQDRINTTIANRLRHEARGVVRHAESQLVRNVGERYAGIRKVNTPQARANHIASEPVDQVEGLVLLEGVVILFNHTLEQDQISDAHGPRELEVRLQCFREAGLPEVGAVGDFAEQQAHQKHPLERLDAESDSRLRGLAGCLQEALLGAGVLKLDGTNAPEIVQVAAVLLVGATLGHLRLGPQLLSQIVQVVVQVVTQQQV
mmetsp:Transcript_6158/g.10693  ORF Transcript_6158/g.10693 Transcript_6158/m.10693 type:complete len:286 (-) Transcript_6158:932-1789(-)